VGTNSLLSSNTTWTAQKTTPPIILRCRGNVFTEPLSSNYRRIRRPARSNKLLLAIDSTVILGSESHGTDDHILLSDSSDSWPFRAVHIQKLRAHRQTHRLSLIQHGSHIKEASINFYIVTYIRCRDNVFTEPLPSNDMRTHTDTQTHGRDSWSTPLRWAEESRYVYQVS
jgi:hypothetical protein